MWHDRWQVTSAPAAAQHLRDLARLRRVRDRIDREYAHPLDVEALARGAHMSAGHLSREFRLAYCESPYGYLMTRRIERAMAPLRRGDRSVTEVCFAVGCSSLGTFSRCRRRTAIRLLELAPHRQLLAKGRKDDPQQRGQTAGGEHEQGQSQSEQLAEKAAGK
jgi:AraC-like DNA-binding protein